jgi:hypothetical protein
MLWILLQSQVTFHLQLRTALLPARLLFFNILPRSGHGRGLWAAGSEAAAHGRRNTQQRRRSRTCHLPPPGTPQPTLYRTAELTNHGTVSDQDPHRSALVWLSWRMRNPFSGSSNKLTRRHLSIKHCYGCRSGSGSDFPF